MQSSSNATEHSSDPFFDDRARSEEGFRLLVQSVKDYAILMLDPTGHVVTWNEGAERIKGWTAEEIIGRSFETFYPEEQIASGFPKYELEVAEREGRFEDEGWRLRKDGSKFWANVVITAMFGAHNKLTGYAKVTRDLTSRREAEEQQRKLVAEQAARAEAQERAEELRALNDRLTAKERELLEALHDAEQARASAEQAAAAATEAYRDLDQFAYAASHDLKAPLRGVANLAQWIEEDAAGQLNSDAVGHIRMLMSRVARMEALIDGILAYSRAGRSSATAEKVDTGRLTRSVVDFLSPPATAVIEIARGMPVIETERVTLEQVLLNLIGNAIKHGHIDRPGVTVQIAADDRGDDVEFTVHDDGPGIPPEYHERIWGIFQTLASRDKVEGTGVGLALVKKIVERRGGRVWVESEADNGTTFHVLWPKNILSGASSDE